MLKAIRPSACWPTPNAVELHNCAKSLPTTMQLFSSLASLSLYVQSLSRLFLTVYNRPRSAGVWNQGCGTGCTTVVSNARLSGISERKTLPAGRAAISWGKTSADRKPAGIERFRLGGFMRKIIGALLLGLGSVTVLMAQTQAPEIDATTGAAALALLAGAALVVRGRRSRKK
jgi:hypothetical protein